MKRFREVAYLGVETGCWSAMNPPGVGNLLAVLPWLRVVAALSRQCSSGCQPGWWQVPSFGIRHRQRRAEAFPPTAPYGKASVTVPPQREEFKSVTRQVPLNCLQIPA